MIISEMAIPAHTIVGALNLDTSFKIKKHIFFIAKTDKIFNPKIRNYHPIHD